MAEDIKLKIIKTLNGIDEENVLMQVMEDVYIVVFAWQAHYIKKICFPQRIGRYIRKIKSLIMQKSYAALS